MTHNLILNAFLRDIFINVHGLVVFKRYSFQSIKIMISVQPRLR